MDKKNRGEWMEPYTLTFIYIGCDDDDEDEDDEKIDQSDVLEAVFSDGDALFRNQGQGLQTKTSYYLLRVAPNCKIKLEVSEETTCKIFTNKLQSQLFNILEYHKLDSPPSNISNFNRFIRK